MGMEATEGEKAILLEMVRAKHGPFYWLLELPNGMWAAFWSAGIDTEHCTELVYGNMQACAYTSKSRVDVENWIEIEREEMRQENPAMAAAF